MSVSARDYAVNGGSPSGGGESKLSSSQPDSAGASNGPKSAVSGYTVDPAFSSANSPGRDPRTGNPDSVETVKRADEAKGAAVHTLPMDATPQEKAAAALQQSGAGGATAIGSGGTATETKRKGSFSGRRPSFSGSIGSVGKGLASGVGGVGKGVGKGVGAVGGTVGGGLRKVGGGGGNTNASGEDTGAAGGLKTDIGGKQVKPSIGLADVQKTSEAEGQKSDGSQQVVPGAIPASKAQAIPDWYKVGWSGQLIGGAQGAKDTEQMRQRDLLESWLSDMYYGSWWHNAAVIFFAVAASHYVTIFGGGWVLLFLILAICSTYYTTSTRRVRRNIRDDVTRSLARQRLYTDHETVDWINNFLHRFWLIYEPVLAATIIASVDASLEAATPAVLDSLRLTTFTLGTKAPRIDYIKTHPETPDDEVVMDWRISFVPNDTADMKVKASLEKVNPKVVLGVRFGKGIVGATKDIIVEDIMFRGFMRIRLKLTNNFPHVSVIDLSFLEKPDFDFVLRPVGFDLSIIPGLSGFIHSQVHANLGPMMYDPNYFSLNLEQMLAGAPIDTAVGVLQITVFNAHGIKGVKMGGGTPDPYISFSVGGKAPIDRTKIKHATNNPQWNSTHFLLLNNLTDVLSMRVMDYNSTRKDMELGVANFDLATLAADAEQEGLTAPIIHDSRPRGEVRFDVTFYPCLHPKQGEGGVEEPVPETSTGVVRLTLHQAKDLDSRKGASALAAYAEFFLNAKNIHRTPVIKRTANPVFESHTEVLISDKAAATVGIRILDEKPGEDPLLGFVNVRLTDIIAANAQHQDWFPLIEGHRGKIRLEAVWKPILMSGAINGASAYRPPIGVVRFWFRRAVDLKNVEALTGGKSDPYVRVLRSGIVLCRTAIFNNNLSPEFDEICYAPIHDVRDKLHIEVMDYEHLGKDRSLGGFDINVQSLVERDEGSKDTLYRGTGRQKTAEYLKLDKKGIVKGRLEYEVEFRACTNLKWEPFEQPTSSFDKAKTTNPDDDKASTINMPLEESANVDQDERMMADLAKVATGKTQVQAKSGEEVDEDGDGRPDVIENEGAANAPTAAEQGTVEMSQEEVLRQQSGILVFNIMGGQLARKNARLEVLFDDGYWPAYSTEPSRSTKARWDETGEGFIRELDWSQIILKLNTAEKETREEVYAQYTASLRSFLDDCLGKPYDFVLQDLQGGFKSTVTIQCKYIPVPIELYPRESVNNMGILTVFVDNAKGLKAADRNGYSDPYAQFTLNGAKVFKSDTKKKTLNPTWNEKFEVEVPSRVHADFRIDVYDWDRVGTADKLGRGNISLADLEPMQQFPLKVELKDPNSETSQGVVNLRMIFRPGFIIRSRQATSTVSGLGRTGTVIGGGVVQVGSGVGHVGVGAVKGVGKLGYTGVTGVGKLGYSGVRKVVPGHKRTGTASTVDADGTPVAEEDGSVAAVVPSADASRANGEAGGPTGAGKLSITVLGATGLPDAEHKTYVAIRLNGKKVDHTKTSHLAETPTWDETFTTETGEGGGELEFTVFVPKTIGKDKELGHATAKVFDVIQPAAGVMEAATQLPLDSGAGEINVRLAFSPKSASGANFEREASVSSASPQNRKLSNVFGRGREKTPA